MPNQIRDAVVVEDEEELFTENAGKSQGDVPQKDVCGSAQVMFPVEDVGGEGVGGVEGLPREITSSWLAGSQAGRG